MGLSVTGRKNAMTNLIIAPKPRKSSPKGLNSHSVASRGGLTKASTLVNGDEGLGGSPGTTITRVLTGAKGRSALTGGSALSVSTDTYLERVAKRSRTSTLTISWSRLISREWLTTS